jgi:uncharacterized membrane protein YoaK (UPF0700 family)
MRSVLKEAAAAPLVPLLYTLTLVTGLVDAVSFLALGHVFVANMTGNVVFLGFALAGSPDFSVAASLGAIAAFLVGALAGGRLAAREPDHRGRLIAQALVAEAAAVAAALAASLLDLDATTYIFHGALLALLAAGMGLQNATARRLGVPDLTTTVLTLTLTGLASDSWLAHGESPRPGRRVAATLTMLAGACVGAFLVIRVGVPAALALALAILFVATATAAATRSSSAPWTRPTPGH